MKFSNNLLIVFVSVLILVASSTSSLTRSSYKINNLKSQTLKAITEGQSKARGFDLSVPNSTNLVCGFITEMMGSNIHKQYKSAQVNFKSMPCVTEAVNHYISHSNKSKILNFKHSDLSADEKFCEDLVKGVDEDDTHALNSQVLVDNQKKCSDILKKHDLGIIDMAKILLATSNAFNACVLRENPVSQDPIVNYAKQFGSLVGSAVLNLIIPGAGAVFSVAKITWYTLLISRRIDDASINDDKRYRVVGKYLARIVKSIGRRRK